MTKSVYDTVNSKVRIQPADAIIEEMQLAKTPEEIEQCREAARVADIGFEAFVKYCKPGMREYEVSAGMDYAMRMAGADDMFILMSSGRHNYEMHSPTDRRLREGDIVIGEITPVLDGLFFQLCRTVVIGKPAPILVEKYSMLMRAFEESIKELVPGRTAGIMSRTMNRIISDAGYGEYCYPPYMRARGHGFGVGSLAPGGAIDNDTKAPYYAGQFIVVHPNQYLPETGYLAAGETLLVTEKGPERLAKTDTRLYVNEV
jgi:Xaa-Pro aminopeptidase